MQPKDTVRSSIAGRIGTITLSNPAKHNALSQAAWETIPQLCQQLAADGAHVLVLTGHGNSFCAGADISEFDEVRKNAETARHYENANSAAFEALRELEIPVIAKIRGYCLGGGFGLAAACDIRVAEPGATFSVPAAKLGLAYPVEAMGDIVAAIGAQNAKRMLFTAARYSANQMRNMGFLGDLIPADKLDEEVARLANQIAELAPLTHGATKAAIAAAFDGDVWTARAVGDTTFTSVDYAEGRRAFKEKRQPVFRGR